MEGRSGGRVGLLACVLAAAASLALAAAPPAAAAAAGRRPSRVPHRVPHRVQHRTPPRGIDVSAYQHHDGAVIDWPRLAAEGYVFAGIKAAEGSYYVNPFYASDARAAARAGILVIPYTFANPKASGGARQARYAITWARYRRGMSIPIELDIENDPYTRQDHTGACYGLSRAAMVAWIAKFAAEVRKLTGGVPLIYTTFDWWQACTGDSAAFRRDPLWIASYRAGRPRMPPAWPGWTFWQYSSAGKVPGVTHPGGTDVDYFRGPSARLRAAVFAGHTRRPPRRPRRRHRRIPARRRRLGAWRRRARGRRW